jgi:hypothetical protein
MVVDQAARLHRRVHRGRPDEAKACALERLGQRGGLRDLGRHVGQALRYRARLGPMRPDQVAQGAAAVAQVDRCARVGDRRLDLGPVADDPGVAHQALDVGAVEAGDRIGLEACERLAERRALAQDRDPGEAGLEPLQAQALEQPALVGDGKAPLVVVVGLVQRVAVAEAAAHRPSRV